MRGFFISIDGCDGCGKTTLTKMLSEYLEQVKRQTGNIVHVRDPGTTEAGMKIREILLSKQVESPIEIETETLLFFAARNELVKKVIRPAIEAGKIVLCERFTCSTVAYQGFGSDVPIGMINVLSDFCKVKEPDLCFIVDVSPEVSAQRVALRNISLDNIEKRGLEYFQKVRDGYNWMARQNDNRYLIDGERSSREVFSDIQVVVDRFMENRKAD